MGKALPDWDRVCRRIVDGDKDVKRCAKILGDETAGAARQLEVVDVGDDSTQPWYKRMLEGESGSWITLAVPVAALAAYMVLNRTKAAPELKQVATAT